MKAIISASLAILCLLGTGCRSTGPQKPAGKPAHNLSISPGTAANLFFCFPGNPQWQYVGSADPRAGRSARTATGAPIMPTLDFDVTTASVVYLRMDLGDVLGEPEAATATGARHAVAIRLTAARQYRLDWQVSADLKTTKGRLLDLGNQVVTEAVPITRNICR
ncbi:hypothetical protein D0B54_20570 [Solimonas sp. K1W22B-7]|uniref:hypothetical protein n=1 Tax=Solimonas sp. K1W22B-7 TaxID=2303331 RepID=UPI000E3306F3|nr:hypothetical protein [Solimonas sp. K1W22B-7]AXQ30927.1 hypothetical protein D0B54_20570 [Solimonas sp. K1W22B-7]